MEKPLILLKEAINILQMPDIEQRSEDETELLIKATEHLEFFKKLTEKKRNIGLDLHHKCCRKLQYEQYTAGSIIFYDGKISNKHHLNDFF